MISSFPRTYRKRFDKEMRTGCSSGSYIFVPNVHCTRNLKTYS